MKINADKILSIKGIARVILVSIFTSLACAGIIKAATTIGNNITTGGTLSVTGTTTLNGVQYAWPSSDGSPNQTLITNGSGTLIWSTISSGSGSLNYGAVGSIPYYASAGTTATGTATSLLIWDNANGRLGIGTSSPYAKLSVVGETVSTYFTATSTTATSKLDGNLTVLGNSEFNHQLYIDTTNQIVTAFDRITNGSFFESGYGWTLGSGWYYSGTNLAKGAGNTNTALQNINLEAGRTYIVTYKLTASSTGSMTVSLGGTAGTPRTASGIWGEEITAGSSNSQIIFTPTSNFDGNVDNIRVFDKNIKGMGIIGESTSVGWNGMGILELYAIHSTESAVAYGNTLYSESLISATANSTPQVDTVTNGYFQTRFEPPSGNMGLLSSLNNMSTSLVFNAAGAGTHSIPNVAGQTIAFGDGNQSNSTYNILDLKGLSITGGTEVQDNGTFNITSLYNLYLGNMLNFNKGTTGTSTGIWLESQTIGTTNRGIVLDGNGSGSNIVFGDTQQLSLSRDNSSGRLKLDGNFESTDIVATGDTTIGDDLTVTGDTAIMGNINNMGSTTLGWIGADIPYNMIATKIYTPYAYINWAHQNNLMNITTETDKTASAYDFIYSGSPTYTSFSSYGGVRLLNMNNTIYATRDNPVDSSFSFPDKATSNGLSILGWVEVTDSTNIQQTIITKHSGVSGGREYDFHISDSEKPEFVLWDQSAGASCSRVATNAVSPVNTMHHIAVVYAGTQCNASNCTAAGQDIVLYVDGSPADMDAATTCTGYDGMEDTAGKVQIGARNSGATTIFPGKMGAVSITADKLSAAQIAAIYALEAPFYGK